MRPILSVVLVCRTRETRFYQFRCHYIFKLDLILCFELQSNEEKWSEIRENIIFAHFGTDNGKGYNFIVELYDFFLKQEYVAQYYGCGQNSLKKIYSESYQKSKAYEENA